MFKKFLLAAGIALLMLAPTTAGAIHNENHFVGKITVCHRTGSETNPFVKITASVNAFKNSGHGTLNESATLDAIAALNDGADLSAFIDIGGHDGDIFLLGDVECPDEGDSTDLVTVFLCVDEELVKVGPGLEVDVNAQVDLLVAAGGEVTTSTDDCVADEITTTTTTTAPPPPPPLLTLTPPPPPPAAPVAPAAAPAPAPAPAEQLPRTGFSGLLALLGAGMTAAGLGLRRFKK